MNNLRAASILILATVSACSGGGSDSAQPTPAPPMQADPCNAAIEGGVWDDTNFNSQQDSNEPFLAAVVLNLRDSAGSMVQTISSDNQGYNFAGLCADDYQVEIELPTNQTLTAKDIGADSSDSDADPASRLTDTIAVAESATVANISFGLLNPQTQDSDDDGIADIVDAFPNDPSETEDSDADGLGNNADAFPNDANEQVDSDSDGVGDNGDAFPNDANEQADSDSDGAGDNSDAFPNNPNEQLDSDGDGTGDNSDAFPNDPNEQVDSDSDGVGDNADPSPTPIAIGKFPALFSKIYVAGDSLSLGRPLGTWGTDYTRKIASDLNLTWANGARGGWTLEQILNGDGSHNQLDFLYGSPRVADPNGLHIVYGGYNDVFYRPNAFQFDVVTESAEHVRSILLEIANAGGRFAMVPLLYDVGKQIASDADPFRPQLRQRTIDFNAAVLTIAADITSGTDMTVLTYDVFTDVEDIYANPAGNGFTDLSNPCGDIQANCVGYFWWDNAHPTDDVHRIIADGILLLMQNSR